MCPKLGVRLILLYTHLALDLSIYHNQGWVWKCIVCVMSRRQRTIIAASSMIGNYVSSFYVLPFVNW